MADVDWKMEAVMQYLKSPSYTYPVMNFIDENCAVFDQEDESKHEFNSIHQNFVELVFGLLEAFLAEIGVTSEEFAAACSTAVQAGGDRAFVFQQIMAVDDFQTFRRMMTKRNYEIEMDALKQMEMIQQKAAQDAGQPPPPPPPETPGQEDLGEFGDIDLEEQRQLEEALALSRMTFEQPQQTAQSEEEAELEVAIAMSKESAKADASRTQKLAEFVPADKALSEEEMMATAIAESLKHPPPAPEEREAASIPQTLVAAPLPPPTPPPEEVEAIQALPAVTKEEVWAAEQKHELAVAEHALALSTAIANQAALEQPDPFGLAGEAVPAAIPAITPDPPTPDPPPPEAPAAASPSSLPPPASASASASAPSSSLPPLRPMGSRGNGLQLAGVDAEEMARMERREAEKAKRDKEQALLTKKIEALKEQPPPAMSAADIAERDKYLKAQRQRLVEAKKKEREDSLRAFHASSAAASDKKGSVHSKVASEVLAAVAAAEKKLSGPASRAAAAGGGAGGEEGAQSEEERKRQEMRKALAKRLKEELTG